MKLIRVPCLRALKAKPQSFSSTYKPASGGSLMRGLAALVLLGLGVVDIQAQVDPWVRFTTAQIRVTVPLNSTNTTVITNLVSVSTNAVNPVSFSVSGLPAGAGATLTDTNGNSLLSTTIDTNLWLTI